MLLQILKPRTLLLIVLLKVGFYSNSLSQSLFSPGITDIRLPSIWCDLGCEECCTFNNYMEGADVSKNLYEWYVNATKCLEAGYDLKTCTDAATYCFIREEIPWGLLGQFGSMVSASGIDQLFRTNCGAGTCFQCCFAGGDCHTSFIGVPPILNCNEIHGSDPSAAGITTNLGGMPGDLCLFTPQTCTHLAVCNLHLSPGEIASINSNPDHIMKSQSAKENRRRWFATKVGDIWLNLLNRQGNSDTSSLVDYPVGFYYYTPMHIRDFITGRGGIGWRKEIQSSSFDWTQTVFSAMNDDSSAVELIPSRLRAIYQAGIIRVILGIPNFVNRFDKVESFIWDESSKQTYLSVVDDPDTELLKHIHPITLAILKTLSEPPYKVLQDYRLLSVPLPDEIISPNFYNGTELGEGPIVKISNKVINGDFLTLSVSLTNLDDAEERVPLVVLWGDGKCSSYEVLPSNPIIELNHNYRQTGQYQVYVISENISGLRGIAGTVIETTSNSVELPQGHWAISGVRLNNVEISAGTTLGYLLNVSFTIGGIDADSNTYRFGKMSPLILDSSPASSVKTNYVSGSLPLGTDLKKLTLEFEFSYNNGGDMWDKLKQSSSWWSASSITFSIWDIARNQTKEIEMPLKPEMLTLLDISNYYGNNPGSKYAYDNPQFNVNGDIVVPFRYSMAGIKMKGVEISIPDSVFNDFYISPMNDPSWKGDEQVWREIKPEYFQVLDSTSHVVTSKKPAFDVTCFPNPFKESTVLSFYLHQSEHVRIDVFDALGNRVDALLDEVLPAGLQQVTFYPKNSSSTGIYYFRLYMDNHIVIEPLVFMR